MTTDPGKLTRVFDSLEAGLCVIELLYEGERVVDHRFLSTNASFQRQSGLGAVEGKRVEEVVPGFEPHWHEIYQRVAETGQAERFEHEARGLGRWFEVSASRLGGPGSHTLVLLFEDVTHRRTSAALLADVQTRLAATMQAGEVATWVWDVQRDQVTADRNLARLFGVSEADASGGPIAAYVARIHPADRDRVATLISTAVAEGRRYEAEYRIVRDDDTRWVIARGNVERDGEGRPWRLPGVVLDVTRQRTAEHALRLSDARLQVALEAGHMGTWDIDLGTGVMLCSSVCKSNYGRAPYEPFSYEDLRNSVHPQDVAGWSRTVEDAVAAGGSFEVEYRTIWPDGSTHWVFVRGAAATEQGRAVSLAGVSMRVDEKKRIEESLRAADRQKDEFLATASHELRTPLNAILGWSRLLRSGRLEPSALVRGLEVIERNATAQVRLIEDILDGSRIISGKLQLEIRPLDMTQLVSSAIDTIRPAAEAKQIELSVTIDARAARITGDPDRLQQVVWNLANNAIKFTPRGGRVAVSLTRAGTSIELSVRDSGQGIAPEFLPHVFERFRQAEGTTTRRHGGLGLGLALVKHLAEAHGGTVREESEGEGRGAAFFVTLPVTAVYEEQIPSEHPRANREVGTAITAELLAGVPILVVDDEADARDLVAIVLRANGAEVTTVSSAALALEALERSWPRVLVSDVGMPLTDGYELMRQVRQTFAARIASLATVALTAYSREEDRRRALSAGFNAYLAKPVEPAELVEVIRAAVRLVDPAP